MTKTNPLDYPNLLPKIYPLLLDSILVLLPEKYKKHIKVVINVGYTFKTLKNNHKILPLLAQHGATLTHEQTPPSNLEAPL